MASATGKDRFKQAVKSALMTRSSETSPDSVSRILTYHSVGNRNDDMNVSTEAFREQIAWLVSESFPIIALEEAAAGKPGIAITFDDGYRDNLTNASPILSDHGISATVFMVTGKAGRFIGADEDESGRLMTWEELRELQSMGFDVGAHTMTHARLAGLSPEQQRDEINGSIAAIRDVLGTPVTQFAYPYGSARDYNDASVELVKECGCDVAVSNRYGYNTANADRYQLRRTWIDRSDSLEMFQAKVTGLLDRLALLESPAGLWARKTMNRVFGRYRTGGR